MTWTSVRTIMVLELRQRVRATRWRIMLGIWLAVLILLCGGLVITVKVPRWRVQRLSADALRHRRLLRAGDRAHRRPHVVGDLHQR